MKDKKSIKIIILAAVTVIVMALCITFFVMMFRAKKAAGENKKEDAGSKRADLYTIDCLDGLSFDILPADFTDVNFTYNPPLFDVLALAGIEDWSGEALDSLSVTKVFGEQGLPLLIMSDAKFTLYNPEGNKVYLAGLTASGGISLFYAESDRRFLEALSTYGITEVSDVTITEGSYTHKNTDDYILSAFYGSFKFDGRDFDGFFVFVENAKGQYYYIGGGDFAEAEKKALSNSLVFKNETTDTTVDTYGVKNLSVSFGADVLIFNMPELFGFNPETEKAFITSDRGFTELDAYNQYLDIYSAMSAAYLNYEGVSAVDFMWCFDNTVFFPESVLSSEKVTDTEGREWDILVFDTDYTPSNYDRCITAVSSNGNIYYVLKTDFSSKSRFADAVCQKFKTFVSSARISQGEGTPYTESTEYFEYYYNFLVLGVDIYAEPEPPVLPDAADPVWTDDTPYDTGTGGVITLRFYNPDGEDRSGFWFSVCEETTGEDSDGAARGVGAFLSDFYGRGHAAYNGYDPSKQFGENADLLVDENLSVNHLPVEGVLDITTNEGRGEISTGIYSVAETGHPEAYSDVRSYVVKINGKFAVLDENGVFVEGSGEEAAFPVTVKTGEKIYLKLPSPVVAEVIVF